MSEIGFRAYLRLAVTSLLTDGDLASELRRRHVERVERRMCKDRRVTPRPRA
jgi:hypothetical protein